MVLTFGLTVFAWIFFRAESLGQAVVYVQGIFTRSLFSVPDMQLAKRLMGLLVIFIVIEWLGREEQYAIAKLGLRWPRLARVTFYYAIVFCLFYFSTVGQTFIYFQF